MISFFFCVSLFMSCMLLSMLDFTSCLIFWCGDVQLMRALRKCRLLTQVSELFRVFWFHVWATFPTAAGVFRKCYNMRGTQLGGKGCYEKAAGWMG